MAISAAALEIEITIDGETERVSLLQEPHESSALVRSQKKRMIGELELKAFVQYVGHVGKFLQIAYNGAIAAGVQFADIQIEIYDLGHSVAKIFDKSAVTISEFGNTAQTVSFQLVSVYKFLLDGFEKVAIKSIESLEKMASEMNAEAFALKEMFEKEDEKLCNLINSTWKKKSNEEDKNEELELEEKKEQERKKHQEKIMTEYYKQAEAAKEERLLYETKANAELERQDSSEVLQFLSNAVTAILPSFTREGRFRKIALQKLKIEEDNRKNHIEALNKMAEFTQSIKGLKSDAERAGAAANALVKASGALKHLSTIMLHMGMFWNSIAIHCKTLASNNIQSYIEVMKDESIEKKREFWQSKGFVRNAVEYHSQWIALRSVCETHMIEITSTREVLYENIRENPTRAKAKENLEKLTQEFSSILTEAKKEAQKEVEESMEEKKELENNAIV